MLSQIIDEALQNSNVLSMEPMLEGDVFEDWTEYSLISDQCYITEELMALTAPDRNVMEPGIAVMKSSP